MLLASSAHVQKSRALTWRLPKSQKATALHSTNGGPFSPQRQANTREFQSDVFIGARGFFEVLFRQACYVLGDPPCGFDIRATGPLGREEMCPFSGFGIMILIDDDRNTPYFSRLAEILELQITSLGETPNLLLAFSCLPFNDNPSGFHLDPRGNPAGEDRLIQTPQAMAAFQQTPSVDLPSVEYAVLRSSSLHANDTELYEAYLKGVKTVMNIDRRQAYARVLLRNDLANFRREWPNGHTPILISKDSTVKCFMSCYAPRSLLGSGIDKPIGYHRGLQYKRRHCGEYSKRRCRKVQFKRCF